MIGMELRGNRDSECACFNTGVLLSVEYFVCILSSLLTGSDLIQVCIFNDKRHKGI